MVNGAHAGAVTCTSTVREPVGPGYAALVQGLAVTRGGRDARARAMADDLEQSAVRDVLISLDVAQVHRAETPFARLREVSAELCETMDGVLCDQNGTPAVSSVNT